MDYILDNPGQSLISLGIILLIVEMLILGFSTFLLSFVGLASVVSGILVLIGIVPVDTVSILLSLAIFSTIFAVLLWKPLKQFQNRKDDSKVDNDFIGIQFIVENNVDNVASAKHQMSGVLWDVKSEKEIPAGTLVKVKNTDVGVLWVEKVES